ncbi:hypothetical protein ACTHSL_02975 [Neisseria sp. P0008.S010]|uniref:hypothetical protein n=1 Tax=Neisseria sp. P0008.S010 TaxID=3436707 RepID=UPI003F819568
MNTKTPLEIKLSAALPVALAGRADEVRTFKGTANSGKPFGYGGTQTVVDFEGLRHKASVPVLLSDKDYRDIDHLLEDWLNGLIVP